MTPSLDDCLNDALAKVYALSCLYHHYHTCLTHRTRRSTTLTLPVDHWRMIIPSSDGRSGRSLGSDDKTCSFGLTSIAIFLPFSKSIFRTFFMQFFSLNLIFPLLLTSTPLFSFGSIFLIILHKVDSILTIRIVSIGIMITRMPFLKLFLKNISVFHYSAY